MTMYTLRGVTLSNKTKISKQHATKMLKLKPLLLICGHSKSDEVVSSIKLPISRISCESFNHPPFPSHSNILSW